MHRGTEGREGRREREGRRRRRKEKRKEGEEEKEVASLYKLSELKCITWSHMTITWSHMTITWCSHDHHMIPHNHHMISHDHHMIPHDHHMISHDHQELMPMRFRTCMHRHNGHSCFNSMPHNCTQVGRLYVACSPLRATSLVRRLLTELSVT